jgi:hypothetical protein
MKNYIFVRLNTRNLNKYEVQRLERLIENIQRRESEKENYIYISMLAWKQIEETIVLRADLYKNLEVDLINKPDDSIQKGGKVGTEDFMKLLERFPREDIFFTEGDIEIDGEVFWDRKDK